MDSVGESLDTLSGFLSLRPTIATPLDSKAVREIAVTVTVFVASESVLILKPSVVLHVHVC